jgi:hypothetical protein
MGKRRRISLTNRRRKRDLHKKRWVAVDFETVGVAVGRPLFPGDEIPLDKPSWLDKILICDYTPRLYASDYSMHLHKVQQIAAACRQLHTPIITARQTKSQLPEIDVKDIVGRDLQNIFRKHGMTFPA